MSNQDYRDYVIDFEKLEVYQLALQFAGQVIEVCGKLPSDLRFTIGGKFIRAAMSIAHNLAGGLCSYGQDGIWYDQKSVTSITLHLAPYT